MYAEPATWEVFDSIVDAIIIEDDHARSEGPSMTDENDDDESKLNGDGIRAQLASLSTVHELPTFSRKWKTPPQPQPQPQAPGTHEILFLKMVSVTS